MEDLQEIIMDILKQNSTDKLCDGDSYIRECDFDDIAEEIEVLLNEELRKTRTKTYKKAYNNAYIAMGILNKNVQELN